MFGAGRFARCAPWALFMVAVAAGCGDATDEQLPMVDAAADSDATAHDTTPRDTAIPPVDSASEVLRDMDATADDAAPLDAEGGVPSPDAGGDTMDRADAAPSGDGSVDATVDTSVDVSVDAAADASPDAAADACAVTACAANANACLRGACSTGACTLSCRAPNGAVPFGSPSFTPTRGVLTGAVALDVCPRAEVVIGVDGFVAPSGIVSQLSLRCGKLRLASSAPGTHTSEILSGAQLTPRGVASSTPFSRTCGAGEIMVGVRGRAGDYLDSMVFRCAPLQIAPTPSDFVLSVGAPRELAAAGSSNGGTAFAATDCASGQIAVGATISADLLLVRSFSLICRKPELTYPLTFSTPTETPMVGGESGTSISRTCPSDEVVVGYTGSLYVDSSGAKHHGRLTTECGRIGVVGPRNGPHTVVTSSGSASYFVGNAVGEWWDRYCPANHVVVALSGRAGSYIDSLTVHCAPLTITGSPGSLTVSRGSDTPLPAIGGQGGTPFLPLVCASGGVAVGFRSRYGSFVNAFGLRCSGLTAEY